MKKALSQIYQWYKLPEEGTVSGNNFADVSNYTVQQLKNEIKYQNKVIRIAFVSFFLWLALLICYCFCKFSIDPLFDIKLYPAPLWALITGAFGEADKLEKRKLLNEYLQTNLEESEAGLSGHIQNSAWDEFTKY